MNQQRIIINLSNMNPVTANDMGDVYCFFCGEEKPARKEVEHAADCIWKAADVIVKSGGWSE